MTVSGDPAELRALADNAKSASASVEAAMRAFAARYQATRFEVANKGQLDEHVMTARQQAKNLSTNLLQVQGSLQKLAAALEQVGR